MGKEGASADQVSTAPKKKGRKGKEPLPEKLIITPHVEPGLSRREVLVRSAVAGGLVLGGTALGLAIRGRDDGWDIGGGGAVTRSYVSKNPRPEDAADLSAVKNSDPFTATNMAVAALGGMKRFISRGDVVVIKPNIGWDRTPLHAANTNPEVIRALVHLCIDAGAKKVVVTDASCNDPVRCFQRSGIGNTVAELVRKIGSQVSIPLPVKHRFRELNMKGDVLGVWPIYTTLIEADKVINAAPAKHHNLSGATLGMKNWYGILGGRRNRLHQNIHVSIADLATFMRPTLTIIDGVRILLRNGPQGGNVQDTKRLDTVVASIDPVAADSYGIEKLLGWKRENFQFLKLGHERKLGTMHYDTLKLKEILTG
jgi:uncharacterized protein (DUF362 family)